MVSDDAIVPSEADVDTILAPNAIRMKGTGKHSGGVMLSNLPLARRTATGADGNFELADIDWHQVGDRYRIASPQVPVSIGSRAGAPVAIGQDVRLRLAPEDAVAPGDAAGENVTFPSIGIDTDMVVRSLPDGVQVAWLLRSPDAQRELRVPVELHDDQRLTLTPTGAVLIKEGEKTIGTVSPATAVDADRRAVDLTARVDGTAIVYTVEHENGVTRYPVVVDPTIERHWDTGADAVTDTNDGWFFQNTPTPNQPYAGGRNAKTSSQRGQLSILGPQTTGYSQDASGAWARFAPGDPTFGTTQSGTTRKVSPEHAYWWRFDAGALAYSVFPSKPEHNGNYPASSIGLLDRNGYTDSRTSWAFLDGAGNPGAANAGLMFNKLPSGTNGTSAAVWLGSNPTDNARNGNGATSSDNTIAFGLSAIYPYYYWQYEHPLSAIGMGWYRAWASDSTKPSVTVPTAPTSWQAAAPSSIPVSVSDRGMGVQTIRLDAASSSPQSPQALAPSVTQSCVPTATSVCPFSWSGSFDGAAIPEGRSKARVTAVDGDGLINSATLDYAIDKTAPTVSASGSLWDARGKAVKGGSYSVTFAADDALSGMKSIKVYAKNLTTGASETLVADSGDRTCSAGGCSLSQDWTVSSASLPDGKYQIRVAATDLVGRTAPAGPSTSWDVTFDSTAPTVDLTGDLREAGNDKRQLMKGDSVELDIDAKDALSGVTRSKVLVDNALASPEADYPQSCTDGGCSQQWSYLYAPESYPTGERQISVEVVDRAGNSATQTWSVNSESDQRTPVGDEDPDAPSDGSGEVRSDANNSQFVACETQGQPVPFTNYSLGASFDGLSLTHAARRCDMPYPGEAGRANFTSYVYGTCEPDFDAPDGEADGGDGNCTPPLEIQTWPACERSLADYLRPDGTLAEHVRSTLRGAESALFLDEHRLEIYTGTSTVVIFADSDDLLRKAANAVATELSSPPSTTLSTLPSNLAGIVLPLLPTALGVIDGTRSCLSPL
jgi:hypothetical protein